MPDLAACRFTRQVDSSPMSNTLQPATEQLRMLEAREVSSLELIDAHIDRIAKQDGPINAVVLDRFGEARIEARAADRSRLSGTTGQPLLGLPFTAKETIEIAGMPVVLASRSMRPFVSKRDAVVVESLRTAGAIPIAKTNIPEHALYYDSNNLVYGKTVNPYDHGRSAGGSSGGEAAALASGFTPLGVGSDLGGSIRIPAHFCGICGLKPSRNVVPLAGHYPPLTIPAANASMVIGPMARTVADLRLALPHFARTDFVRDPDARGLAELPAAPRRVAACWEDGSGPVDQACRVAVEKAALALSDAGYEVEWVAPPLQSQIREVFIALAETELRTTLGPILEAGGEVAPQMAALMARIRERQVGSLGEYIIDQMKRHAYEREVAKWQQDYPLILSPVASVTAFPSDALTVIAAGEKIDAVDLSPHSTYANVLGLPATAVPADWTVTGLPVGVQITGRRYAEYETLDAAAVIEEALGGWRAPAEPTLI